MLGTWMEDVAVKTQFFTFTEWAGMLQGLCEISRDQAWIWAWARPLGYPKVGTGQGYMG
jgi:hypothetical protein